MENPSRFNRETSFRLTHTSLYLKAHFFVLSFNIGSLLTTYINSKRSNYSFSLFICINLIQLSIYYSYFQLLSRPVPGDTIDWKKPYCRKSWSIVKAQSGFLSCLGILLLEFPVKMWRQLFHMKFGDASFNRQAKMVVVSFLLAVVFCGKTEKLGVHAQRWGWFPINFTKAV